MNIEDIMESIEKTVSGATAQAIDDEAIAKLDTIAWELAKKNGIARPEDVAPQAVAGLEFLRTLNMEINGHNPARIAETVTLLLASVVLDRDRLKDVVDVVRNNIPMSYLERHGIQNIVAAMRDYSEQRWAEKERIRDLAAERDRLAAQLAEARAEGWRRGIEAAAAVNNFQAPEILDNAAPASAVNALRWAEKCIRALPMPADLREAVDMISGK